LEKTAVSEAHLTNFHYAYLDMIRHWHPDSEKYTGGDALFTAVSNGWKIDDMVRYEDCWLRGGRYVVIYYFELKQGGETITMPVVTNPYVQRFIASLNPKLVALDERKIAPATRR
jgi:hypothetical protein